MEKVLKEVLGCSTVKSAGRGGGGCISQGQGYMTDIGHVFVKQNPKSGAELMFRGEMEGLHALEKTGCIRVPKPIKMFKLNDGGAALILEYLDIDSLGNAASALGENLARLHLHNQNLSNADRNKKGENPSPDGRDEPSYIDKFGFDVTTCCGYLPQENSWMDEWPTFYMKNRLQPQIDMAVKNKGDTDLENKWQKFVPKIPHFFRNLQIYPSLLHGDLWSGNTGRLSETGEPVVFDPAVVYGHHEFDLAIGTMFGGLGRTFFDAYHKVIPKEDGFAQRQKLYQLFHYLNHYNHFGSGYRSSCLQIIEDLSRSSPTCSI